MNKAMLIGNVGQEPEVHYYDRDQCVARVRLATTERGYTLPNGTRVPDRTDWHSVIFYNGLAKVVEKYVHKGDKLYVEGRLRYRSYDDKKGVHRLVAEIYAENMEMLTPRRNNQQNVNKSDELAGSQSADSNVNPDNKSNSLDNQNNLPF